MHPDAEVERRHGNACFKDKDWEVCVRFVSGGCGGAGGCHWTECGMGCSWHSIGGGAGPGERDGGCGGGARLVEDWGGCCAESRGRAVGRGGMQWAVVEVEGAGLRE